MPKVEEGDAVAVAVALADKLDTLVGFWAIGEKPTGCGDPYQLRRAALGVIRIVLENDLRLPLRRMLDIATADLHRIRLRTVREARSVELVDKPRGARHVADECDSTEGRRRRCRRNDDEVLQASGDLLAFFADRLKVHLREKGARHDLIDAVFRSAARTTWR